VDPEPLQRASNRDEQKAASRGATACPCCRGERGRWQHFELPDAPDSWDHADGGTCECGPRFDACLCCDGAGEVSGLKRVTLLARGDIVPVQRRGRA
jgi:hypothetical protein